MARLFDHKLELEISYQDYLYGWVEYGFDCRWDGEPIFNDRALKPRPEGWPSRGRGQMYANEDETCCLLPFLHDLIIGREPDFVTPIEPDFTLAIWPRELFPFLPSEFNLIYMSDELRREIKEEEAARAEAGGILDDDRVQLILAFDASQFRGASYLSSGPALHMMPTWRALKTFAEALRQEFRPFAIAHGILDKMEENGFLSDEAMAWWRTLILDERWRIGTPPRYDNI